MAHIVRGHVDHLDSKTGVAVLPEIGFKKPNPADLIERQTMERDADQRSFSSRLHSAWATAATPNYPAPPWLDAPLRFEELFFDFALSVGTSFRIFGDARFARSDITNAWYPPEPLRRAMVMRFAAQCAQTFLAPDLKNVATAALRSGTMACESASAAITGESTSGQGLGDAVSPQGMAHMKLLEECWMGGLRDRLAPFAFESV
jgi:hypothetical protein